MARLLIYKQQKIPRISNSEYLKIKIPRHVLSLGIPAQGTESASMALVFAKLGLLGAPVM